MPLPGTWVLEALGCALYLAGFYKCHCRNAFTEENSSMLLPNARVYSRKHENVTN